MEGEHTGKPLSGGWARGALIVAAFVAAYLVLDWVSYIHPMQQYSVTPWNPQPALAIALIAWKGQRWMAAVFLAVVAAEWTVRGGVMPWPTIGLIAAVLTLGYAAMASALTGRLAVRPALETSRDMLRLVAVIGVGALATGFLYIAALVSSHVGPLEQPFTALVRFWIGDVVGILVTLPFVFMMMAGTRRRAMASMLRRREAALHALVMVLALAVVFSGALGPPVKYFYLLFLPLILTASRFGLAGSILALLCIQLFTILSGQLAGYQELTVFELQALLIALTVTGLFLGVIVDERRRAEEGLRRSLHLAAAGQMAAALAHELNQPLTALTSYAHVAGEVAGSPAPDRSLLLATLEKLRGEATRAGEVVRRLRDFFRTGATRLAPVSLLVLAQRVVAGVEAGARARDARVDVVAADDLPAVLADEIQVEVVLRNLVANALEASGEAAPPRRVVVEISKAGDEAVVAVRDSGPGIADADAERIFEPFETTRASGMGMGLAISRAIVEAHGGRLWAEPAPQGRFFFTLPLRSAEHE